MPTEETRVEVSGSARRELPGAQLIGELHPDELVEVTVRVRPGVSAAAPAGSAAFTTNLADRRYLTREELRTSRGADPADIAAVRSFAADQPGGRRGGSGPAQGCPGGPCSFGGPRVRSEAPALRLCPGHISRASRHGHHPGRARRDRRGRVRAR